MNENNTRLTLIQKLKEECNENSWEEFIKLYQGYIFVILKKMSFNDEDCHDIMQATFLKVWKNVQKFDHGGANGQFRKWLTLIAKNTALNHIRKNKRGVDLSSKAVIEEQELYISGITSPEVEKIADDEWAVYISNVAWSNIKNDINDKLKSVFELIASGRKRSEISEILDIPLNTVSVYKRRVIEILQKEIVRLEKDYG